MDTHAFICWDSRVQNNGAGKTRGCRTTGGANIGQSGGAIRKEGASPSEDCLYPLAPDHVQQRKHRACRAFCAALQLRYVDYLQV